MDITGERIDLTRNHLESSDLPEILCVVDGQRAAYLPLGILCGPHDGPGNFPPRCQCPEQTRHIHRSAHDKLLEKNSDIATCPDPRPAWRNVRSNLPRWNR